MMAKNPVEEFLTEKRAFGLSSFGKALSAIKPQAQHLASQAGTAVAVGAGSAAFAGLTLAAGKLYEAATKTRDYKRMLEANPDLEHYRTGEPENFNRMFSALRTMAPEFTKEPLVAGSYMRKAMEGYPEQRGSVAVQALNDRHPPKLGPLSDAALSGFSRGLGMGSPESPRQQLVRQLRTQIQPGADGNAAPSRIEEIQNYYG